MCYGPHRNEVITMKIECKKCGYEWDTNSDLIKVTCPNCGYKTSRSFGRLKEIKETVTGNDESIKNEDEHEFYVVDFTKEKKRMKFVEEGLDKRVLFDNDIVNKTTQSRYRCSCGFVTDDFDEIQNHAREVIES